MLYPEFAKTLLALQAADLRLRDELIARGELEGGYHPEMEALHNANAERLSEMIDAIGYPTAGKVGEEASAAAWLVVQHAISRPALMRRYRDLLQPTVKAGDASARRLAYLTDRIAVFSDAPQRYGTQFDWDENGRLSPNPVDDPEAVDARRSALGMNTLGEQTRVIREQAAAENRRCPADLTERRAQYDAWRRSVGWIN